LSFEALDQFQFDKTHNPDQSFITPYFSLIDANRQYYFKNLGIHKSFSRACRYLFVGIKQNLDFFLDWCLIKFIAEAYHDTY
jgi:hypothetical protein